MRIEKVNDDKIKVLIEEAEAKAWNLSFKSISENTPEAQRVFRIALRLAEENVNFSVQGAKLFVEAVQCEDNNGFGMMITRVDSAQELKDAIAACSYRGKLRRNRLPLKQQILRREFYRFSEFDIVCAAAEQITGIYQGESSLYRLEDSFYLYLEPAEDCAMEEVRARLCEFGYQAANGQYIHGRLNEYGEKMIEKNALSVMQEYFCVH